MHTYQYSARTLAPLLARAKFAVRKVYHNSNYWGLIGSMQAFLNRHSGAKADAGWLAGSRPLRILAALVAKGIDRTGAGDVVEMICERR